MNINFIAKNVIMLLRIKYLGVMVHKRQIKLSIRNVKFYECLA